MPFDPGYLIITPICVGITAIPFILVIVMVARRKMNLHWRALLLAILIALPFIGCASASWIVARGAGSGYQDMYQPGDIIYILGAPLTFIVLHYPCCRATVLQASDDSWALSLLNVLFIVQWVIWGQLLALGIRLLNIRLYRE